MQMQMAKLWDSAGHSHTICIATTYASKVVVSAKFLLSELAQSFSASH